MTRYHDKAYQTLVYRRQQTNSGKNINRGRTGLKGKKKNRKKRNKRKIKMKNMKQEARYTRCEIRQISWLQTVKASRTLREKHRNTSGVYLTPTSACMHINLPRRVSKASCTSREKKRRVRRVRQSLSNKSPRAQVIAEPNRQFKVYIYIYPTSNSSRQQ